LGIEYDVQVLSAHRSPDKVRAFARAAGESGFRVIIAGAGMSAALAGVIAAHTTVPVVGVPIASGPLQGVDALLSTVQMPPGVPVAAMGIGQAGARNAALLAAQVLALQEPALAEALEKHRRNLAETADKKNQVLRERLSAG
jgi:phosphoribosylaminoimidazole carboxylase PurE protein